MSLLKSNFNKKTWSDGSSAWTILEVTPAKDVSVLSENVQQQVQFKTGKAYILVH